MTEWITIRVSTHNPLNGNFYHLDVSLILYLAPPSGQHQSGCCYCLANDCMLITKTKMVTVVNIIGATASQSRYGLV